MESDEDPIPGVRPSTWTRLRASRSASSSIAASNGTTSRAGAASSYRHQRPLLSEQYRVQFAPSYRGCATLVDDQSGPRSSRHGGLADVDRKRDGLDGSVSLAMSDSSEKARRRAAREMVGDYHDRELWKSCNLGESAAWAIEDARERGEEIDWWAAGEHRRRR